MHHGQTLVLASFCVAFLSPALAAQDERYQLERTQEGYVRLDTQTGRMSLCVERNSQLICKMAADDHEAYERDLYGMAEKIDKLEQRIARLEAQPPAHEKMPSEEEFEQTLGYMERFFRSFMGIVGEFDQRFGDRKAPEPTPDRT